jgi:hypothetical protein
MEFGEIVSKILCPSTLNERNAPPLRSAITVKIKRKHA